MTGEKKKKDNILCKTDVTVKSVLHLPSLKFLKTQTHKQ